MVLGTMVCPSFVLGGDANTGSAGYVCLETGESDFHAAMHAAIAFAALMGWPSCFAVDSPAGFAALSGGMLCKAALSGFLRRFCVLAAMLFWAALSDGKGGYACCVEYSLEFLFWAAMLFVPLAAENTRLFILLEIMQVVSCVENSVPGSSSQEDEADFFECVEVPLLSAMADVVAEPVLDDMVSEVEKGRVALTCHFSLGVLCSEMHQPHVFLPHVLSLDVLIPVNEVRKACGIPEPAKSVQILFRGGHGLGVWDLEAHTTLALWFSGGKRGVDLDGYFTTIGGRILNSEAEVCNLGLGHLSEVVLQGGCWVAVLLA